MANRFFQQFFFSFIHMPVFIEGNAVIGSAGAVGTIKGSGVKTVTHTGTGAYTIVLEDTYNRYLTGGAAFINASTGSGIASVEVSDLSVQTHVQDGTGIQIKCYDYTGAAADPAANSVMGFWAVLRNSSVKGKGE